MWKNYYSVTQLNEALQLLVEHQSHARIIAGGTDMIIELDRGQRPDIDTLIDITRLSGLNTISQDANGIIHLGALVTHNQAVADALITTYGLPLAQACWEVGAPQIRNRATIAGNLITASPANDTITPLMALHGRVTLTSTTGQREIPLAEFYTGVRRTVMRPDEMLTRISFTPMADNERGVFLKLGLRRAQAIAVINICVILGFDGDIITSAKITMGSVAPTIIHIADGETYLIGKSLSEDVIKETARRVAAVPQPIDDIRGTADYRIEMIKTLTARALRQLRDKTVMPPPAHPAMLWGINSGGANHTLPATIRHEDDAADTIATTINGQSFVGTGGANKTLLHFLREDADLIGTKEGCGEGECGACTVYLDGAAVMACMVPAPRAHGAEIVTIEGLAPNETTLHPLQQAFIETGAVQCGFCIPGILMAGAKLLEETPTPSDEQIAQSISGNLCRCTGYYKIIEAFHKASDVLNQPKG